MEVTEFLPYDPMPLILSSVSIGLSIFCASLLFSQKKQRSFSFPLILFFVANGLSEIPTVARIYTDTKIIYLARMFFLLMLPCFWLYVRALTSKRNTLFVRADIVHFAPFIVCAILVAVLSPAIGFDYAQLWNSTPNLAVISLMLVLVLALVLLPILQFPIYAMLVLRRATKFHLQLKDMFSSTEDKELGYIYGIGAVFVLYWALHFGDIVFQAFGNSVEVSLDRHILWKSVANLAFVWMLALWSMRQSRVLAQNPEFKKEKYSRSALKEADLDDIGQKIERAMKDREIHLNPNLSLRNLSQDIGVLPNYVSQALNVRIGQTFFDYVNGYRIDAAKNLLKTTNKTVLEVAFDTGFNSRSAFYRAFNDVVGTSPSEYKKSQSALS